jgi:hypothetical protein
MQFNNDKQINIDRLTPIKWRKAKKLYSRAKK